MRREYDIINTETDDLLFHAPLMENYNEVVNGLSYTNGSRFTNLGYSDKGLHYKIVNNFNNGGFAVKYTATQQFRTLLSNYDTYILECSVNLSNINQDKPLIAVYIRSTSNAYCNLIAMSTNDLPINTDIRFVTLFEVNRSTNKETCTRYAYYDGAEHIQYSATRHDSLPEQVGNIWIATYSATTENITNEGYIRDVKLYGRKPGEGQ